ncbi:MAG: glutamate 5-kinase [Planctomycetota bacterium]
MDAERIRLEVLAKARRVVVKVGSQLVTARGEGGGLRIDRGFVDGLCAELAGLMGDGYEVTLVCSGAIAAGCAELGLADRPTDLPRLQAVAAVGQRRLMTHLHEAMGTHDRRVGQVLLTRGDFDDRARFLNVRNCLNELAAMGVLAVANENDAVAVDEIRYGDNDLLAAHVAHALRADALVLLTGVDGLLDGDSKVVSTVTGNAGEQHLGQGESDGRSAWGSGGMATKLEAGRLIADAGEVAVIANGRTPGILRAVLTGEPIGTVFVPADRKLDSRRRWTGLTRRTRGTVVVNAGAAAALRDQGKSLLAVGVTSVDGAFATGDVVAIVNEAGGEIGRGVSAYDAATLRRVMGMRSEAIAEALGEPAPGPVVHRDDLAVRRPDATI